ncbi:MULTISPECIES: bifunctional adenosylcobinamide kinase/adenosylcobinamide-phosphate guanylyltransferase [unclassified Paenibacillus]|uniref:bifunctional adenosylcobinamide kinase/adenosylcobinamide-phosphate guanylyltransferase n=1 Tax=unclassified Paenibacillus TaxID=185978 RepID=UPI00104DDE34|nr:MULTISPECIES: bifunctional adenosylcobinamide kinase/adenosylcobinamide-phosphate guanylyltransferase [unclassified Paenibacillus]NIK68928.1 adenosylcobinamide kinase/adenosylcobinamide-phosphate guanylyltransferase [Paenibacillus sp. BK720]TCM98799.1 adenosylcobinamide kinase /adenosylcobinamide-phosphate guanylyltransferase [Paenibacillus sp. BK033]
MAMLVTGGARSGKSSFAEKLAARLGEQGVYLATSRIWDGEMAERIALHQQNREQDIFRWTTIEEPMELPARLRQLAKEAYELELMEGKPPVVLIDCLTLWLTNVLMEAEERERSDSAESSRDWLSEKLHELAAAVQEYHYPLILVTNEVGDGIVPAYPLGRRFRDEAGRLNQRMAALSEKVFLVTAGIPVELKALAFRWESL